METIKKTRTIEYEVYRTSDGKEFEDKAKALNHQDILDGKKRTCALCGGKGQVNKEYVDEHQVRNELTCEFETIPGHYRKEMCPVCNGRGYLELKWS